MAFAVGGDRVEGSVGYSLANEGRRGEDSGRLFHMMEWTVHVLCRLKLHRAETCVQRGSAWRLGLTVEGWVDLAHHSKQHLSSSRRMTLGLPLDQGTLVPLLLPIELNLSWDADACMQREAGASAPNQNHCSVVFLVVTNY